MLLKLDIREESCRQLRPINRVSPTLLELLGYSRVFGWMLGALVSSKMIPKISDDSLEYSAFYLNWYVDWGNNKTWWVSIP